MERLVPMSASVIQQLAERLHKSDLGNAHEQREIFERIRELRSAFDGPLDPESHRCLEAASMLVAYLSRMGNLAGEDVRQIAVRLLRGAADAENGTPSQPAAGSATSTAPSAAAPDATAPAAATSAAPAAPAPPARSAPFHVVARSVPPVAAPVPTAAQPTRSATDVMGDMLLGQILLQRGHILEEHIQQAMKVQRMSPLRIGDIFVKIGACSRAHVTEALTQLASIRRVRENLEGEPKLKEKPPDTRGTGLKLVGEAMIGEILIERNVITRRQLERALDVQKQTGTRIGEALVKIGATTMEQIEQALRIQGRDRRFGTKSTSDVPTRGDAKR